MASVMFVATVQVLGANLATTFVLHVQVPATPAVVSAERFHWIFWPLTWVVPLIVQVIDAEPVAKIFEVNALQRAVEAPGKPNDCKIAAEVPDNAVASAATKPWESFSSILVLIGEI